MNKINQRKRTTIVFALMLVVASGGVLRNLSASHIRAVDFVSIFVIGALTGLLIARVIELVKSADKSSAI